MARKFEKYDESNPPIQCFMTNARWYKESGAFTPKGILWHDTGADNPWLKRYVQPDDDAPNKTELLALIGKNTYGNDWNHGGKDKSAGLNCWVGKLQDGTVTTLQAGPWNKRPWGCGSGSKGSLNDTHIQWEICEDAKKDVSYFGDVYEESVQLSAYLCRMFKIDPKGTITYKGITVPTIVCHWDAYKLGCGSGHDDIYDWSAMYEYLGIQRNKVDTNDPYNNLINLRIREDIYKAMQRPTRNGWVEEDGKWYYYKDDVMLTSSWVRWKGDSYYVGSDGAMVIGWQKIGSLSYYFYKDGRMARGEWIDGKFLDMDGVQDYTFKAAWKKDEAGSYFQDNSGWYAKNRTIMIDGKAYTFDKKGYTV